MKKKLEKSATREETLQRLKKELKRLNKLAKEYKLQKEANNQETKS